MLQSKMLRTTRCYRGTRDHKDQQQRLIHHMEARSDRALRDLEFWRRELRIAEISRGLDHEKFKLQSRRIQRWIWTSEFWSRRIRIVELWFVRVRQFLPEIGTIHWRASLVTLPAAQSQPYKLELTSPVSEDWSLMREFSCVPEEWGIKGYL